MTLTVKPVELVNKPLNGATQFEELNAPASGEIYLGQIVKDVSGTATLVAGTDTSGYKLAVSDTSATLPAGSYVDKGLGWHASRPSKIRVIDLAGKLAIVSAKGTLATSHIGTSKTFIQEGRYTVLDLASNPASGGAKILGVVEGTYGDQYARVLVQL